MPTIEPRKAQSLQAATVFDAVPSSKIPQTILALGIALVSIFLFVMIGSEVFGNLLEGTSDLKDPYLAVALILNIALILLGWRHYNEVSEQLEVQRSAAERAEALATFDPLTGLLNRRAMSVRGSTLLEEAKRKGLSVATFVIDLDGFKQVNDAGGHQIGDELLMMCGKRIWDCLPNDAILGRLGGDEFAASFPLADAEKNSAKTIADMIVENLSRPMSISGNTFQVSASVGLVHASPDQSIDTLLRRADIAMYAAKREGRNCSIWFDESMERLLDDRNQIEAGIRAGLKKNEFLPYYEPQIDLATGQLRGFEVLARWHRPKHGVVMPDDFISVAEESGLITELSDQLMKKALNDALRWSSDITLSVNISPVQLKDPWLAQKILRLLSETRFPAVRLELEITETALFDNLSIAQTVINSLKNQGVRFALDDFGTGYSSLSHLRSLPFDRIKIDRSFVCGEGSNAENEAIVEAIARLGQSLDIPVTAEGIETEEVRNKLRDLGIAQGQGWLFGKPMDLNKTRRKLAALDKLTEVNAQEKAEAAMREIERLRRSA